MAVNKPVCKYGAACYRKNKDHLRKFSHPPPTSSSDLDKDPSPQPPAKRRRKDGVDSRPSPPGSKHSCDSTDPGEDDPRPPLSTVAEVAQLPPEERSGDQPTAISIKGEGLVTASGGGGEDCDDLRDDVRKKFLIQMPEDFYQFWEFCKSLNPTAPGIALKPTLGLDLVGPFHVLSGHLKGVAWDKCVLHSRYYHDPPELVTVLSRDKDSGYHIGYFRDDPKSVTDCLLVTNSATESFELKPVAKNIFDAVRLEIVSKLERHSQLPASSKQELQQLKSKLLSKAEELGLKFSDPKSVAKQRSKVVLSKCLHKMGLVVPYDEDTELGYRSLPMSDRDLLKLLNKISNCKDEVKRDREFEPLQEIITFVQFANDECDYGMGLELGLNLFSHGGECFHSAVSHLLPLAYDLLQREEFGRVVGEHLEHRSKKPLDFRCT